MQIITDNISFLQQVYRHNLSPLPVLDVNNLMLSPAVIHSLFDDNQIYSSNDPDCTDWACMCAVNNAPDSHLKLLADHLKKNVAIPDKFLIVAQKGDGFIGYKNRKWIADEGNLHLTVFLKPHKQIIQFATGFTIIAVVSILQTLDQIEELKGRAGVRWVNDVVIDNKKIAGVLSRTQVQGKIVENASLGLGINIYTRPDVTPDIFVPDATHIAAYADISISTVFNNLTNYLHHNYQLLINGQYNKLWQFYISRSVIMNRKISVYSDPVTGRPQLLCEGVVDRIGSNLELYLKGMPEPISKGRIVLH
jgi:biotin-(acetyl-CoA carboxylase) ligase